MPLLTFLEADRPLVKSYTLDSQGNLVKESYPRVWEFTSHSIEINGLQEFHAALVTAAAKGWCLLKGELIRVLKCESRAGSTDPNTLTWFICLDFDRLPQNVPIQQALELLALGDCSYIVQYSASHGIEPEKGATAHVFVLLSTPAHPAALKQWLIGLNLRVEALKTRLELTRTHNALSWPLDVSTCQNDKLIYIAPPQLGAGVVSAHQGERICLIERAQSAIAPEILSIPTVEANRTGINAALDALRTKHGLPARRWSYKVDKTSGLDILAKPDASTLSGVKRERGFTYFNLNGGDSWGYYHPDDAPEVIRNFKGEANYLTSELLPEYWGQVQLTRAALKLQGQQALQNPELQTGKRQILAFRDFRTAIYYNGYWDPGTEHLELARAASERQLQDYLKGHGLPEIEPIPVWNLIHDPHSDVRVNVADKTLNTFEATQYMKQAHTPVHDTTGCPLIVRLLHSAVGQDPELVEHQLNWLACVFALRAKTQSAWAWHGVQGTGKGLFVYRVLIPLLGLGNVVVKRMEELEDQFNGYIERALLVVIDEAQISESRKSRMVMANLKNMITEPEVSVRKMHSAGYTVPNWSNWIFLTNQPDPVQIEATDRRFNVGEYQQEKLVISSAEVDALEHELPVFANYLRTRAADLDRAREVLENEARAQMRAASMNSVDATAHALMAGDLEFFWDALPAGEMGMLGPEQQMLHEVYAKLIQAALKNPDQRYTRDELRVFFAYNVGDVPRTPAKFASMLRHHRIHLKTLRVAGKLSRGIETTWKASDLWIRERLEESRSKVTPLKSAA